MEASTYFVLYKNQMNSPVILTFSDVGPTRQITSICFLQTYRKLYQQYEFSRVFKSVQYFFCDEWLIFEKMPRCHHEEKTCLSSKQKQLLEYRKRGQPPFRATSIS
jgi:hypothetical protein